MTLGRSFDKKAMLTLQTSPDTRFPLFGIYDPLQIFLSHQVCLQEINVVMLRKIMKPIRGY